MEGMDDDFEARAAAYERAIRAGQLDQTESDQMIPAQHANPLHYLAAYLRGSAGAEKVRRAELQQQALSKEQAARFDDIAKQLATPGTKRVLVKALGNSDAPLNGQNTAPDTESEVPLSPVEENQRQMGLGLQMSKLPMARGLGLEFVKSGAAFPERMAVLESQQRQQTELARQRSQDRADTDRRHAELITSQGEANRASREAIAAMAAATRGTAGANADLQRELLQARIDRLNNPAPAKESAAAEKARHDASVGIAAIDDAIAELNNPDAKNALGYKNVLPSSMRQYTDPKGIAARAAVANIGSLKLHDRSGAAITASEFPRLAPFIPSMTDTAETAKIKLGKMKQEYARMREEWAKSRGEPEVPSIPASATNTPASETNNLTVVRTGTRNGIRVQQMSDGSIREVK